MARTIRRKHRVPGWVTEKSFDFIDSKTGAEVRFTGIVKLEGSARQENIRIWHGEHPEYLKPSLKSIRQQYESQLRMDSKQEIARYLKNEEYEVMLLPQTPKGYWLWCGCWHW